MNIINLYEKYVENKAIFALLSKIAAQNNVKIYLVGGIVRDILLNRPNSDVDICVEGDAIEFANFVLCHPELVSGSNQKTEITIVSTHKDFGTAKIKINGIEIDLASTRTETYPHKGHLPLVGQIGCTLESDASRRDFTINSMAMSLNHENFGEVIDYLGGLKDLQNKVLRVLHPQSFIDDPTRILRGLKFALRFGFELAPATLALQEDYLANINEDMCYKRVKDELKDLLSLDGGWDSLIQSGAYKLITKTLQTQYHPELVSRSHQTATPCKDYNHWLAGLGILTNDIEKFELNGEEKWIILKAYELLEQKIESDFEIYKAFVGQKIETLLIYETLSDNQNVQKYLAGLNKIKLEITGEDLIAAGHNPSKKFGECLDFVLKEKIARPQMSKNEELKLVEKFFCL